MLFEIVAYVVYGVLLSVGGLLLFVLYRRFCVESAQYSVVNSNSAKASRAHLYPNLDHTEIGSAPVLEEENESDSDSLGKPIPNGLEKRESLPREPKAVENDYVVPSELNTIIPLD